MDLIMMGTGKFAVPTFRRLLGQSYNVRLLVTQPDRPEGRHQTPKPPPTKELAIERGVAVFQPEDVNTPEAISKIAQASADLLLVAAYGQILSKQLLELPRHGGLNVHASLLPKYRGAAPVNWAIYHGETVTGITIIQMTPRLDAGAILLEVKTQIGPSETAGELEERLAAMAAPLACQAINGLAAGTLCGKQQDRSGVTRAPKLRKEHGRINWTRSAVEVCNQVRAMQPWPWAFTYWHRPSDRGSIRLIIEQASPQSDYPAENSLRPPGTVVQASGDDLIVWAGDTAVRILRLRPAGKRSMSAEEFLRGNPIQVGDQFSDES